MCTVQSIQITLFGDDTIGDLGFIRHGPNFYQWTSGQDYRNCDGKFRRLLSGGTAIDENDYLPRRLLGEYLFWAYKEFLRDLPFSIRVKTIHKHAIDLENSLNSKIELILRIILATALISFFITTGHGENIFSLSDCCLQQFVSDSMIKIPRLNYYSTPYPLDQLDDITSDSRILVQGLGLAAYNVLSQLTHGRGGKFTEINGQLKYISSGLEPNVAFFSSQCLPFGGQGINQRGASGQ